MRTALHANYFKLFPLTLLLLTSSLVNLGVSSSLPAQETTTQVSSPISESYETADFVEILDKVNEITKRVDPKNVLFVVDIDNTLLAMDQDLGSDQWFGWQESLLAEMPKPRELVANDFGGLLRVQGILFSLSEMHCPEPRIPSCIDEMKKSGCRMVVLTSRGPEFRDAAERELKRNNYDFNSNALTISEEERGRFKPYGPNPGNSYGLTEAEIQNLGKPRDVTYSSGIFMVAGQHKGYMLRTLLARSNEKVSTVVFVDDHEKHTKRMAEAFKACGINLFTYRYSREDGNVAKFVDSDKMHVVLAWQKLKAAIQRSLVH